MENCWNNKKLIEVLKEGGMVVMPTDTIYGVVGQALNFFTIERIHNIKDRREEKPYIVLIGDLEELKKISIKISESQMIVIHKYWPGPVSIILDCPDDNFSYLHRGTKSLALRFPENLGLQDLLKKTGPLVATSANITGSPVAKNIVEAKKYFCDSIDMYIDGGEIDGKASKLIKLHKDGSVDVLRN